MSGLEKSLAVLGGTRQEPRRGGHVVPQVSMRPVSTTPLPPLTVRENSSVNPGYLVPALRVLATEGRPLVIVEAGCGRRWPLELTGIEHRLIGIDIDEHGLAARTDLHTSSSTAWCAATRTRAGPATHPSRPCATRWSPAPACTPTAPDRV